MLRKGSTLRLDSRLGPGALAQDFAPGAWWQVRRACPWISTVFASHVPARYMNARKIISHVSFGGGASLPVSAQRVGGVVGHGWP